MAKKIHTPEEIATLREEAGNSERVYGSDHMTKLYAKARRWELELERSEEETDARREKAYQAKARCWEQYQERSFKMSRNPTRKN